MPKLKTKSSAKKRFRITKSGKVKMPQSGKKHGMIKTYLESECKNGMMAMVKVWNCYNNMKEPIDSPIMKDIIKSNPVRDYQNNFINNFINEYLSSTNIIVNNIENMDRVSSINTVEKLRTLNIQMENLLSNIGLLSIKPKIIVCNVEEGSLATENSFTKNFKTKYPAYL